MPVFPQLCIPAFFFFPLSPLLGAFIETCFPVSPHEKDLHDSDNHDGVITHLESDILE